MQFGVFSHKTSIDEEEWTSFCQDVYTRKTSRVQIVVHSPSWRICVSVRPLLWQSFTEEQRTTNNLFLGERVVTNLLKVVHNHSIFLLVGTESMDIKLREIIKKYKRKNRHKNTGNKRRRDAKNKKSGSTKKASEKQKD